MIDLPEDISSLHRLVDNKVMEHLHLDYKRSDALSPGAASEIAKDVSAFANSDGGLIVYGIEERDHYPEGLDGGVNHNAYNRERLEQVILGNIRPRIDGVRIVHIPLTADRSYFAIKIPRSSRAPHQSADKKYYKRFNFASHPMEDYEIDDVRNRRLATQGELSVSVEASQGILMQFVVANLGSVVLRNITFEVPSELLPLLKSPNVFTRGIRELQPRKRYTLNWGTYLNLTAETSSHPTVFDITATYNVGLASELSSDVFHIDLQDYWNTAVERSDLDRLGETLKKSVDDLTGEVRRLVQHAERLTRIAAPTGMSLSVTALRNLRHVLSGDDAFERLAGAEPETLMEVLDVEPRLAVELAKFLRARGKVGRLEDVEGMTPELLAAVRSQFKL